MLEHDYRASALLAAKPYVTKFKFNPVHCADATDPTQGDGEADFHEWPSLGE